MGAQDTNPNVRQVVEEVLDLARERLEDLRIRHLEAYLELYVEGLPERFLQRISAARLLEFLLARIAFLTEDLDTSVKVRISRPTEDIPLLRSGVTVVETRAPDATFVVRTLKEFFRKRNLQIDLVVHPLVGVVVEDGVVRSIDPKAIAGMTISHIYLHVSRIAESDFEAVREALEYRLRATLRVNQDFAPCLSRLAQVRSFLGTLIRFDDPRAEEAKEALELIDWLSNQNYVFLGYCSFRRDEGLVDRLGLLAIDAESDLLDLTSIIATTRLHRGEILSFYRTDVLSVVKSEAQIRYIGFHELDGHGEPIAEHVFLGLLSSNSKNERNSRIPIIQNRMREVLDSMDIHRGSYAFRRMFAILNSIPNEDLFYSTPAEIRPLALFIRDAEGADHTRVRIARRSTGRRISTCCVLPRAGYSEALKEKVSDTICRFLGVPHLRNYLRETEDDGPLRLHFYVSRYRDGVSDEDLVELETLVARAVETWEENLQRLLEYIEEAGGRSLADSSAGSVHWDRFGRAFSAAYRQNHSPERAVHDIRILETLLATDEIEVEMAVEGEAGVRRTNLRIYSTHHLILNDIVPVLENMALRARGRASERIETSDGRTAWVTLFEVAGADFQPVDDPAVLERLTSIIRQVLRGQLPDDPLLALGVLAGLDASMIALFGTYRNYFTQVHTSFAAQTVNEALLRHPQSVAILADRFETRFSTARPEGPAERAEGLLPPLDRAFLDSLEAVSLIHEDLVLRRFQSLMAATVRTNFYRPDRGEELAIKIESHAVDDMPRPRPLCEIYVRGPFLDGIHLRGGKVARGGLRHSDRPDDFRTEILDLMKTQMTKNSVIVPVGSKGGFVTHRVHEDRAAQEAEVEGQYRRFIASLLDLTDNVVDGEVVPPPGVIRYDGDDPYLVVAADKGTATFSDIANEISRAFGFWLDDAFASGGSSGYDHKRMGITARGAWECVRRHFQEMGVDVQTDPITVAGVGDMAGDVFGNGMLRSPTIRLVAAFNHRHIFIDPDPDPAASFAERKRLFETPRSTWADYDRSVLSAGGAVFERTAKTIDPSPEARRRLGLADEGLLSGPELIRRILTLDVDLLWFGGIGTYVKASDQNHFEAGDKVNDDFRVDASTLRARVLGEGANLGMTSRARIEFCLAGGRCNTDAVDNSAGVDCSDHEVNLKILLGQLVAIGRLTLEARDRLLRDLTDEVGAMCVRTNYLQGAMVSLDQRRSRRQVDGFIDLVARLETWPGFHRPTSSVPADDVLREWATAGRGLPRNVLAELAAHAKNELYQRLLESEVLDLLYLQPILFEYFPKVVSETYPAQVLNHPLRREILATVLANRIVNQAGATYLVERTRESALPVPEQVVLYVLTDDLIGGPALRRRIEELDRRVDAGLQYEAHLALETAIRDLVRWQNWNVDGWVPTPDQIDELRPAHEQACQVLKSMASERRRRAAAEKRDQAVRNGFPEDLAEAISDLALTTPALPILAACRRTYADPTTAARLWYRISDTLHLDRITTILERQSPADDAERRFHLILERKTSDLRGRLLHRFLGTSDPAASLRTLRDQHAAAIEDHGVQIRAAAKSPTSPYIPIFLVLDDFKKQFRAF